MKITPKNLVCQYLENISRDSLSEYIGLISKYTKGRHGIYALYRKDKLYYVGLATNLKARVRHHLNDRHAQTWDRFSVYLTVGDRHLRELEALLLRIVAPVGNRQKGNFSYAENLNRTFLQDLRHFHRAKELAITGNGKPHLKAEDGEKPAGILAKYLKRRTHIRMYYKDKLYTAYVRPNGTIVLTSACQKNKQLKNKVYYSPSGAASAITGRAYDGWRSWFYERAPGDWVKLDYLRN